MKVHLLLPLILVTALAGCSENSLNVGFGSLQTGPSYIVNSGDSVHRTDNTQTFKVKVSHFYNNQPIQVELVEGAGELRTSRGNIPLRD